MLPRLQVNPITNEVKADEGNIQFCINGIKVEAIDVQALSPKDIIRVEYHDNPGVRYGNVAAVLDYIVKRETTGGSVNLNLSNSPVTSFGNDQVAIRLNHKNRNSACNIPHATVTSTLRKNLWKVTSSTTATRYSAC